MAIQEVAHQVNPAYLEHYRNNHLHTIIPLKCLPREIIRLIAEYQMSIFISRPLFSRTVSNIHDPTLRLSHQVREGESEILGYHTLASGDVVISVSSMDRDKPTDPFILRSDNNNSRHPATRIAYTATHVFLYNDRMYQTYQIGPNNLLMMLLATDAVNPNSGTEVLNPWDEIAKRPPYPFLMVAHSLLRYSDITYMSGIRNFGGEGYTAVCCHVQPDVGHAHYLEPQGAHLWGGGSTYVSRFKDTLALCWCDNRRHLRVTLWDTTTYIEIATLSYEISIHHRDRVFCAVGNNSIALGCADRSFFYKLCRW